MGTTGLVAQAAGAGQEQKASLVLAQSCILALALACTLIVLHPLWLGLGLSLMAASGDTTALADSYATIRMVSAPAVLVTYAVVGWFIGHQNTRWRAYHSLLSSNRDLFIRTVCLLFCFAFFTATGNKLGSDVLAANTLMMQLVLMAAYAMDGFALSAEALSGNRLGARDLRGFYQVVRCCSFWCARPHPLFVLSDAKQNWRLATGYFDTRTRKHQEIWPLAQA